MKGNRPQGTWQGQPESKTDAAGKGAPAPEVSEPGVPYQAPGSSSDRNQVDKDPGYGDESDRGTSGGPEAGQSEDDLPF